MNEFLEWLRVMKKRTPGTLAQYRCLLREFSKFEPVSRASFSRYAEKISKNAPKTQKNKLTVIKEYLNWKADRGKIDASDRYWNQADSPRCKRLPKAIEITEVQKIIKAIDDPYWKAFFSFMANTGARISEVLTFEPEKQASFSGGFAMISFIGKGNKERTLRVSRAGLDNAIEAGVFKRRVTIAGAGLALKRYAKKAGVTKHVTPHILRHTFAVTQITNGMPINQLQAILGHSSVATTGVYLEVLADRVTVPTLV
jgi:integrase/recombinase XerD